MSEKLSVEARNRINQKLDDNNKVDPVFEVLEAWLIDKGVQTKEKKVHLYEVVEKNRKRINDIALLMASNLGGSSKVNETIPKATKLIATIHYYQQVIQNGLTDHFSQRQIDIIFGLIVSTYNDSGKFSAVLPLAAEFIAEAALADQDKKQILKFVKENSLRITAVLLSLHNDMEALNISDNIKAQVRKAGIESLTDQGVNIPKVEVIDVKKENEQKAAAAPWYEKLGVFLVETFKVLFTIGLNLLVSYALDKAEKELKLRVDDKDFKTLTVPIGGVAKDLTQDEKNDLKTVLRSGEDLARLNQRRYSQILRSRRTENRLRYEERSTNRFVVDGVRFEELTIVNYRDNQSKYRKNADKQGVFVKKYTYRLDGRQKTLVDFNRSSLYKNKGKIVDRDYAVADGKILRKLDNMVVLNSGNDSSYIRGNNLDIQGIKYKKGQSYYSIASRLQKDDNGNRLDDNQFVRITSKNNQDVRGLKYSYKGKTKFFSTLEGQSVRTTVALAKRMKAKFGSQLKIELLDKRFVRNASVNKKNLSIAKVTDTSYLSVALPRA